MEIVKRKLNFNNDEVLTAQINGKLYVSIKQVCKNLGMTENQANSQRQKVRRDLTLNQGCVNFHAGVFDPINPIVGIELDYLPLWLAKINPARFNDKLKGKLLDYQLHAKDVLASAFLDKPKQLSLPKIKEPIYATHPKEILKNHVPLKKYYNKVPVMGTVDLAYIIGCSLNAIHYHAGKNKTLIHKNEIANFKKENPMLPTTISNMTILYREEVINICKKMKVYDKIRPHILTYFDDSISETTKVSSESQEFVTAQNLKADKLLQVLPYISEEGLKSHIAIEVIRLIDNKILEEYENGRLNIKFIGNPEKRLEHKEDKSVKTITAKN